MSETSIIEATSAPLETGDREGVGPDRTRGTPARDALGDRTAIERPPLWRDWRGRLLPLLLLGSGLAISAALLSTKPEAERKPVAEPIRRVPVGRVVMDRHDLSVTAHGAVEPQRQIQLVSEVEGRIAWLSPAFTAGGGFASGEVLLRLEDTDYVDRLREAEAEVALAQAEVREAGADLEREQALARDKIASDARLGDVEMVRDVARARLQRARAMHDRAQRDLDRVQVRAPFAGRVRDKYVDLGQFVRRGSDLARIFASDVAEVRLPVSTRVLDDLAIPSSALAGGVLEDGPAVSLTGRIGQDVHVWSAHIVRVEAALDRRNRTAALVARLDDPYGGGVSNAGLPLLVGLFVEARIDGRTLEEAALLPRAAFHGSQVGVVDSGRLVFREVEVAAWEGDVATVVSGLREGEQVCLDLPAGSVEGMRVAPLETSAFGPDAEEAISAAATSAKAAQEAQP